MENSKECNKDNNQGKMNFVDALQVEYLKDPCGVQATALWKTLKGLENFKTYYQLDKEGISKLDIYNNDSIVLHWRKDTNSEIELTKDDLKEKKFVLIQDRFINNSVFEDFNIREPYFRLIHHHDVIPKMYSEYTIVDVNIEEEAEAVATFIGKCYDDMKPTVDEVRRWTTHPVFREHLWIWIMDEKSKTPAGLGIAELDTSISEGSLEWIQVLPEYQGKGIGKLIVSELLERIKTKAKFTTVAGRVDNETKPEALYRKCGFKGEDIWWALRRDQPNLY